MINIENLKEHINNTNVLLYESYSSNSKASDKELLALYTFLKKQNSPITSPAMIKILFGQEYGVSSEEFKKLIDDYHDMINQAKIDKTKHILRDPQTGQYDTALIGRVSDMIEYDLKIPYKKKKKSLGKSLTLDKNIDDIVSTFEQLKSKDQNPKSTDIKNSMDMLNKLNNYKIKQDSSIFEELIKYVIFILSRDYIVSIYDFSKKMIDICRSVMQNSIDGSPSYSDKISHTPFKSLANRRINRINTLRLKFKDYFNNKNLQIMINKKSKNFGIVFSSFKEYLKLHLTLSYIHKLADEKTLINQQLVFFPYFSQALKITLAQKEQAIKNKDAAAYRAYNEILYRLNALRQLVKVAEDLFLPTLKNFVDMCQEIISKNSMDLNEFKIYVNYLKPSSCKFYQFNQRLSEITEKNETFLNFWKDRSERFEKRFNAYIENLQNQDTDLDFDVEIPASTTDEEMRQLHIKIEMQTEPFRNASAEIIASANTQNRPLRPAEIDFIKNLQNDINMIAKKICGSDEKFEEYTSWLDSDMQKDLEDKRISDKMIEIVTGKAKFNRDGRIRMHNNILPKTGAPKRQKSSEKLSDLSLPPGTSHTVKTGSPSSGNSIVDLFLKTK